MKPLSPLAATRRSALVAFAALSLALSTHASAWEWSGWGKSVSGSGVIKTESRKVSGFKSIGLAVPGKVTIIQGTTEGITIETDDNLLPLIETEVEGDRLRIRTAEKTNLKTKTLNITINAININGLSIAGSGDVKAASIKTDKLTASVAGSGNVKIDDVQAEAVKVSIAGSGDVNLGGNTQRFDISISGSGDVRAGKLAAGDVKVSIAGSGNVTAWAKDNLGVSIAGSGDVAYYGEPKVKTSKAGSGSVKSLGKSPI